MVEKQLVQRGIFSKDTLRIIEATPRHEFTLPQFQDQAYSDYPLPINCNQTISQPYIVALMTQELDINKQDIILEIGTGCGYQTAILAQLCQHVYSIEIHLELVKEAQIYFRTNNYTNITCIHKNGHDGFLEKAPYNKIIVTAAPQTLPIHLLKQLSKDGTLIIPIGTTQQELFKIVKTSESTYSQTKLLDVRFVPMV